MPGCVLHVVGKRFDPTSILSTLSLRAYSVFQRGDRLLPGSSRKTIHRYGGFKCDVSSARGDLSKEAKDAIRFLIRHRATLSRLASVSEVESICLDFGYYLRIDHERCRVQTDRLPAKLLRLCGELNIDIELSLYPAPSD